MGVVPPITRHRGEIGGPKPGTNMETMRNAVDARYEPITSPSRNTSYCVQLRQVHRKAFEIGERAVA
jgi:hypothetical protein